MVFGTRDWLTEDLRCLVHWKICRIATDEPQFLKVFLAIVSSFKNPQPTDNLKKYKIKQLYDEFEIMSKCYSLMIASSCHELKSWVSRWQFTSKKFTSQTTSTVAPSVWYDCRIRFFILSHSLTNVFICPEEPCNTVVSIRTRQSYRVDQVCEGFVLTNARRFYSAEGKLQYIWKS